MNTPSSNAAHIDLRHFVFNLNLAFTGIQKEVEMVRRIEMVICDGCGTEVTWSPVVANDRQYCCIDCQEGRPCDCGARMDEEDEHRDPLSAMFDAGTHI
jgi:hypothetical protein